MNYRIGKVTSVSGDEVYVSLGEHDATEPASGVPETMAVDISTPLGPIPVLIGQPGTFVLVSLPAGYLLCMVTGIEMREGRIGASDLKQAANEGVSLEERVSRSLSTIPVGTLQSSGAFERGIDVMPTVNAPVYAVLPEQIDQIYASYADGDFALGRLSVLPNQQAKINLDSFLTRHAAILGQTGGGKSWTVASLIQKMCAFPQSTVVLLDLHGEYGKAFGSDADVIPVSDLELPYWLMNSEELLSLMVDRSESAAPNQIAKFKELLQSAKESNPENRGLGVNKITIDTPVYFDFDEVIKAFRDLDKEMVTGVGRDKQGPLYGQFTRLLMRIDSRLNDRRYDLIFRPRIYTNSASMDTLFRRILGELRVAAKRWWSWTSALFRSMCALQELERNSRGR